VRGVPILGRLLSCLVEQGFKRLVVVVGYRGEQVRDYLESNAPGLTIDFVDCRIAPILAINDRQSSTALLREARHPKC
jgi:NDP-sugar pyrophosphorylase family protein